MLVPMRNELMKECMTIKEAAEKWGIGTRHANTLCHKGRIDGVVSSERHLPIPTDAEKPSDKRIKSGKYIKNKTITEDSPNE